MKLEGVGELLIIGFCFWVLPWVVPLMQRGIEKLLEKTRRR